jgi:hypothetical protein
VNSSYNHYSIDNDTLTQDSLFLSNDNQNTGRSNANTLRGQFSKTPVNVGFNESSQFRTIDPNQNILKENSLQLTPVPVKERAKKEKEWKL